MCFCTVFHHSVQGCRSNENRVIAYSSESSTAYTGQGCTWTHHFLWWLHGGAAGFSLDRGKWPWCGPFVCRPWSNFCMSHWRGQPLTPSFQQWHWNPSQGMSAWPAVIASQSWCHRITTFPQSSSQLQHTLVLLSVSVLKWSYYKNLKFHQNVNSLIFGHVLLILSFQVQYQYLPQDTAGAAYLFTYREIMFSLLTVWFHTAEPRKKFKSKYLVLPPLSGLLEVSHFWSPDKTLSASRHSCESMWLVDTLV